MNMKLDINLSEREEAILDAVIDTYVRSAEPVGSRAIAQKFDLGLSPATIRNTMQDLEEQGILQQPHTSAGRVPTDLGYRYYVDRLLKPETLSEKESDEIRIEVDHDPAPLNEILAQTSKVLARVTRQLGVTVAPIFDRGVLKQIDLVQVSSSRILVIISVRSGLARTLLLEVDSELSAQKLEETRDLLNERLVGLTLGELQSQAADRLRDCSGEARLIKMFIESSDRLVTLQEFDDVHVGGTTNIMSQPEFRDIDSLAGLMKLIEDRTGLLEWITAQGETDGIVITIGKELDGVDLSQCSLVTSTYKVGRVKGTIGVLGPTRMPYSKLVSVVEYTSRMLTQMLSK